MVSQLFSSLAAPAFAALLFLYFLYRRSREINAAANDGTARGDSGTPTPTGVSEMATSSGPAKDAAANDGTAGGDFGAHTSMATSSGANKDAAANHGMESGDSGTHTSTEVPEIDTSSKYDYEVFLSFRGPDIRATFTDHLYTRLTEAGIRTFKDDESLRMGEEFAPELLQAIKQSKILIPIFSKNYASSPWCLKELAQMVKCKKNNGGHKIIPIFYDVEPAEVKHQIGDYGQAFRLHESKKRHDEKIITEWRAALRAVGEINGHDIRNRREGEFVKTFTQEVFNELKKASLGVSGYLVSVDNHVDAIMEMIGAETSETRIIGIHGMGGIGKTTTAKIIYNQLSENFENCCFLSNIREMSKTKGIEYLQNQLISNIVKNKCIDIRSLDDGIELIKDRLSNKRVLLLLDDVEEENHIHALVCNREWLGKGSKIIITTRRIDVLDVPEVDYKYKLTSMNPDQSLQLFSKHAFRRGSPLENYIDQSNRAIDIAGGLPLALEVIGSLLCRTKKEMWDATLKMLESIPHDKIQSKLKISYDALNFRQQHMFLDIACLFVGYDKDILVHFWSKSDFFPEVAMEVLRNMSLVNISEDNKLCMHDQLRDLGREMVREESGMQMEKQSRVWDPKVGSDLLRKHKGKKEAEALRLDLDHLKQYRFTYEDFESIADLRFLQLHGSMKNFHVEERLLWRESPSNVLPISEHSRLLPKLRWISWPGIPPTLNITKFSMEDVVILNLSKSEITDDWKGWSHMKVMKRLKVLDLFKCRNLQRLPDELGRDFADLEYLSVSQCDSLDRLPDSFGNLKSLIELDISFTRIKELPDSIGNLENLKVVNMYGTNISDIPDALWTIGKLEEIRASKTGLSQYLHGNIGNCIYRNKSLRILRLTSAEIFVLPRLPESLIELELEKLCMDTFPDLSNLTNLKELDLWFCDRDSNGLVECPLPQWIEKLSKLESLRLTSDCVTTSSPADLILPRQLKSLRLWCPNLRCLPRLPSSLSSFHLDRCSSLCTMEDLSHLKKLSSLRIGNAAIAEIQGLGCLENLRVLHMSDLGQVKILPDMSKLDKLRSLQVWHCANLVEIEGELPRSLDELKIRVCRSLEKLPDLSSVMGKDIAGCDKLNLEAVVGYARKNPRELRLRHIEQLRMLPDLCTLRNSSELRVLHVANCGNLVEIQGPLPQCLEGLTIFSCESLRKLPDLSGSMGLRQVVIHDCGNLVEIPGKLPRSLEELTIWSCESLKRFPDLSSLIGLRKVSILKCANLVEIPGELPPSLQELTICSCKSLQKLPDMSSSMGLQKIRLGECDNLVEIQGQLPQSLENLRISSCKFLQELPNLLSLKGLRKVEINRCKKLNVEAISSLCSAKSIEFVGEVDKSESEFEREEDEFISETEGEDEESEVKDEE